MERMGFLKGCFRAHERGSLAAKSRLAKVSKGGENKEKPRVETEIPSIHKMSR
jgi:hypothetical protein